MMTTRQHDNTAAAGIARPPSGPPAERHLSVVRPAGEPPLSVKAQQILALLAGHILVAEGLGLEPLTVDERAAAMLDVACGGWRSDRRCRHDGELLDTSHSNCVRAQYHHDVLLLEHGLLDHERDLR